MSRSINFSARVNKTVAEIYTILSEQNFWNQLMNVYREYTPISEIINFQASPTKGIIVELKQTIPRKDLPPAATSIIKNDMVVTRKQEFSPLIQTKITGKFSASIPAGPGTLTGVETIFPGSQENTSVWRRVPTAKVFLPFIGGKLEQLMLMNLIRLFKAEENFLKNWQ